VTRFVPVAGLALHHLWITFRLLTVVAAIVLASLPAALLPRAMAPNLADAPLDPLGWYARALAVALTFTAMVAALTIGLERRRGTAGWLAARAVPRATILLTWFGAFALLVAVAMLPAGAVGWLSLASSLPPAGPVPFVAALASAASAGLAAIALGLLAGTLLGPLTAAIATLLLAGPPLLAATTADWSWAAMPGGGLAVLAGLSAEQRPIADALLAAGTSVAVTALLLVAAVASFERADL
jgi:ABC-type transport system involved in multi-copper enzyme maturation permease subunit